MNVLKSLRKLVAGFVIVAVTLTAVAEPLSAQTPSPTAQSDWKRVKALYPETPIWVKTTSGQKMKGELFLADDESLTLYHERHGWFGRRFDRKTLTRSEVAEVRITHPTASALVGAGIGAAAGATSGYVYDTVAAEDHEFRGVIALIFGLMGALVGGAVGRGTAFIRSKPIYVMP